VTDKLDRYALSWIEQEWSYKAANFAIFPVERHSQSVHEVMAYGNISPNWIYPPQVERAYRDALGPSIMFMLPPTHYISFVAAINDSELSDFAISALGFLLGLNLKPSGMGHLHRTPRVMGTLVNFVDMGRDLEKAMNCVISFLQEHKASPGVVPLMSAAIHWYLTSQSYHHAFEQFLFQYSVLDNIHRVTMLLHPDYRKPSRTNGGDSHSDRPLRLAAFYNIRYRPNLTTTACRHQVRGNYHPLETRWSMRPVGWDSR